MCMYCVVFTHEMTVCVCIVFTREMTVCVCIVLCLRVR